MSNRHFNCCVPDCDSRGSQSGISFHKFPPDNDSWSVRRVHPDGRVDKIRRRKVWEDRLLGGRKASATYRVCSLHFEENDFLPSWEARARKWNHLKKTSLPSRNLHPRKAEVNHDVPPEPGGKVLETELPDGTVCEFFTSEEEKEDESSNTGSQTGAALSPNSLRESGSDDGSSTYDAVSVEENCVLDGSTAAFRKRKASEDPLAQLDGLRAPRECQTKEECSKRSRKVVDIFDFDGVVEALERGKISLPGSSWSYSLLSSCVLLFLCWDDSLRLIKKAVLRKGSPLELFCNERPLASRAVLRVKNYAELELVLNYLDRYEWCPGIDSEGTSSKCDLYTLNGKLLCSSCDNQKEVSDSFIDYVFDERTELVMESDED